MCHPVQKVHWCASPAALSPAAKGTLRKLLTIYNLVFGHSVLLLFQFSSCLLPGEQPEPVELLPEGGELGAHVRVDLPHLGLVRRTRELADRNLRSANKNEEAF